VRLAAKQFPEEVLARSTLFTSTVSPWYHKACWTRRLHRLTLPHAAEACRADATLSATATDIALSLVLVHVQEPCVMCAGSIYWSGISRVVFAFPESELRKIAGRPTLALPCREVFERGTRQVDVLGPAEVELARAVHEGFWETHRNGPKSTR
jgi:tRNA(Arg) A34 adenosine deaminase TadA